MFSIIMPLDDNRLKQFRNTKRAYDAMPQKKEFIIPTRSELKLREYFKKYSLDKDVRIIPYTLKIGFNSSRALNIGVSKAKYDCVIITSPEVKPITPVLEQLEKVLGTNVVCQVWDEKENSSRDWSMVNTHYRSETPAMYFLAMFNKADIEKINGWDEEFLKGWGYEDRDFGARWVRVGIPFVVRDDIQALHQYHPRVIPETWAINYRTYLENKNKRITRCRLGLKQE